MEGRSLVLSSVRGAAVVVGLWSLVGHGSSVRAGAQQAATEGQAKIAELWSAPDRGRDLFHGVGGRALAPDPSETFRVIEVKVGGFSAGYTVTDQAKREWSAKLPPEAATEVVASRLLWGIGYHQPPVYFLPSWSASGTDAPNPQLPARFREKEPRFHGLKEAGVWSFGENPFMGSTPLKGLLVLQVMLGNSDLKAANNAVYELEQPVHGANRWYVVRDLGHTFGRSGVFTGVRGDPEVFEKTRFILGVEEGRVELAHHGRHRNLFEDIRVDHVVWIAEQLNRLTDAQWRDAFRAGGVEPAAAERFIARLKGKVAEGLALRPTGR
jgi:hypothetical protein